MKMAKLTDVFTGFLVFLILLGIPGLEETKGQGKNSEKELEKIVKAIQDKYKVSITLDADAVNLSSGIDKKLKAKSDQILKNVDIDGALKMLIEVTELQYEKLRDDYFIIKAKKQQKKTDPEKKNPND